MDEVAIVPSGTAIWPVEIAAWDGTVIARLNQLVGHLHFCLLVRHQHLLLLILRL